MALWKKIDKTITDLPKHEQLSKKIANYVKTHKRYNKAQIQQICDIFYDNCMRAWGIADDLWFYGIL